MNLKSACLLGIGCVAAFAVHAADLSATATESYQIRNQKFGDLLRPRDANNADGTAIVLYPAQPWKCMTWKLQPAGASVFHVQNHFTSKTFIVKSGDDAKAVIQTPYAHKPEDRPAWKFTKLPDDSYEITDVKTGEALTAVENDGQVIESKWEEKPEQKWNLEKIDPATLTM